MLTAKNVGARQGPFEIKGIMIFSQKFSDIFKKKKYGAGRYIMLLTNNKILTGKYYLLFVSVPSIMMSSSIQYLTFLFLDIQHRNRSELQIYNDWY